LIEESPDKNKVALGSTVTVVEDGTNDPETYKIVGSAEADALNGHISNESPLGAALMGKKVGAKVVVKAPAGKITFKIKKIE